jgi:hypothetical protein
MSEIPAGDPSHTDWLPVSPRVAMDLLNPGWQQRERDDFDRRRLKAEAEMAEERLRQARAASYPVASNNVSRPVVVPELVYASPDDRLALYVRNVGDRAAREVLVSAMAIGRHSMAFEMVQVLAPSDGQVEVAARIKYHTINIHFPPQNVTFSDALKSIEQTYLSGGVFSLQTFVAEQVIIPFTITYADTYAENRYGCAFELVFADPDIHVATWIVRAARPRKRNLVDDC